MKTSGEGEQEVVGTTPPAKLGGPKEPVGSPVSFQNPPRTPALGVDIGQLDEVDLIKYLNGLTYDMDLTNGESEVVACVHSNLAGDTPCGPNEGAEVYIEPEIGAHKWAHSDFKATPHGAVVARILNYDTGDRKEKTFGFPPHRKVWWVVDIDPSTQQARSRFFKRTYTGHSPFIEQVGGDYPFVDCGHVHPVHHGEAIAKYVSCSQSLTMQSGADVKTSATLAPRSYGVMHQASFTNAVPLPKNPTVMALTSTWITCDMGCCSTTQ